MSSEGASSIPVTRSCLCGNVTYKTDTPIMLVGACHCKTCHRISGAAYNLAIGVPHTAIYNCFTNKSQRNVTGETKNSPLWSVLDANKEISFVKGGTLSVEVQKTLQPNMEV
ncbi:DUF636 domain-containing protein [Hysterangium stoloniferum]|nr:DUF636 domain-containing protein [Hysterangium stoloniferum]